MMLLQPALEVSQWHLEPSIDGHFKGSLCSLPSVVTHIVRLSTGALSQPFVIGRAYNYLGLTVGGGLEKLSQGRNFFFLIPARSQLSAYANHEFKIISTPAQLSAYANHELKN